MTCPNGPRRSKRLALAVAASLAFENSALLNLPPETLDGILDHVDYQVDSQLGSNGRIGTLDALSLTCRALRHPAQERLLSRIVIRTKSKLEDITQYAKQLHAAQKTVIRCLHVERLSRRRSAREDRLPYEAFAHLLLLLSRLETLGFGFCRPPRDESPTLVAALTALTGLRELSVMAECVRFYHYLTRHLPNLSSLKVLTWSWTPAAEGPSLKAMETLPPLSKLNTLRLPASRFLEWPWDPEREPSLRFVHVLGSDFDEDAPCPVNPPQGPPIKGLTLATSGSTWQWAVGHVVLSALELLILEKEQCVACEFGGVPELPIPQYSPLSDSITTCACSFDLAGESLALPSRKRSFARKAPLACARDYLLAISSAPHLQRLILFPIPPWQVARCTGEFFGLPESIDFVVSTLPSLDAEELLDSGRLVPRTPPSWYFFGPDE